MCRVPSVEAGYQSLVATQTLLAADVVGCWWFRRAIFCFYDNFMAFLGRIVVPAAISFRRQCVNSFVPLAVSRN